MVMCPSNYGAAFCQSAKSARPPTASTSRAPVFERHIPPLSLFGRSALRACHRSLQSTHRLSSNSKNGFKYLGTWVGSTVSKSHLAMFEAMMAVSCSFVDSAIPPKTADHGWHWVIGRCAGA
eukprot:1102784-Amphidinium_carterae.1